MTKLLKVSGNKVDPMKVALFAEVIKSVDLKTFISNMGIGPIAMPALKGEEQPREKTKGIPNTIKRLQLERRKESDADFNTDWNSIFD